MVKCPNCGEENRENAVYCRKCGEKLQTSVYVKRKEPWGIVHIGVILLSVLLLITSFGLIMGGTGMRSFKDVMTDDEGYLMSNTQTIQVPSYGIVADEIDIELDQDAMRFFQRQGGFVSFKVTTESLNPTKEVFVGVARYADAYNYIEPMEYHEIDDIDMGWNMGEHHDPVYVLHPGDAPGTPPTEQDFWIVQESSTGEQTISWEPEEGNYYVVLMNADGSEGIEANIKVGVQVPFFGGIGDILIGAGVVVGAIGLVMLYFTIKRNQP